MEQGSPGRTARACARAAPPLLALAALAAYRASFAGVFVLDDHADIELNPFLTPLWPPENLWAVPGLGLDGRPVAAFTLALDRALHGLDPRGFHATNLAIHVLAALALFGVVRRALLARRLRERFGGAAAPLALSVSLLWVVHPLTTASVTYVVQRCESLMGLFLLATVYGALRSFDSRHPRAWQAAAMASCALGMGCKEVMVAAPLVVLLCDVVLESGSVGEAWRRRRGLILGLALTWILLAALVLSGGAHRADAGRGFFTVGAWDYLKTQAVAVWAYLRLAVFPHPLVFDRGWPVPDSAAAWLPAGLGVIALLALTALGLARRHPLALAGAAFFLVLAPSSSFVPIATELVAEHRMYVPLAAVLAALVAGGFALARRLRVPGPALGMTVAALAAAEAVATDAQNRLYRSEETLWARTVELAPENPRAHVALGDALRARGRADEARTHYREAVRLQPEAPLWRNNLGASLFDAGDVAAAAEQFRTAVALKPSYAQAHYNLAQCLARSGDLDGARAHLEQALAWRPGYTEARKALARLLAPLAPQGR